MISWLSTYLSSEKDAHFLSFWTISEIDPYPDQLLFDPYRVRGG